MDSTCDATTACKRIGYNLSGTLSYLTPSQHIVRVENGLSVKILRINDEVGRVFFVDAVAEEQRIPSEYVFQDLNTGDVIESYENAWLIAWTGSYELKHGEEIILSIQNQREQVILETFIESNEIIPPQTASLSDEPNITDA
jgi:hypothetical protein